MLLTAPDQTVLVEDDGIIYEFTMADEVVRGGVLIEKRDLESGLLTPLGGASLDGTLFEITNKSVNAVYVNGALYQPGEYAPPSRWWTVLPRRTPGRSPTAPTRWWSPSLVRATSTRTRPCALSRFGKMGRSSSSETAMLPITRW